MTRPRPTHTEHRPVLTAIRVWFDRENGKREVSGVKRSRPRRLSGHKEKNCHVYVVSLLFAWRFVSDARSSRSRTFFWWWLSGILIAGAVVPVALFGPRRGIGQFAVIGLSLLIVTVLCTWSEARGEFRVRCHRSFASAAAFCANCIQRTCNLFSRPLNESGQSCPRIGGNFSAWPQRALLPAVRAPLG